MTPDELRAQAKAFWSRVTKTETCWLWHGYISDQGYGIFYFRGSRIKAHRSSWMLSGGSIPTGMQLDHLCRVRHCVNPNHLEVVDSKTNTLRGVGVTARNALKETCKNGHPLSSENVYLRKGEKPWRICIPCRREIHRRWFSKRGTV